MADYKSYAQVATLKTSMLRKFSDNIMSLGVAKDLENFIASANVQRDLNNGWEVVSHSIQFAENRQIISLLLRPKEKPQVQIQYVESPRVQVAAKLSPEDMDEFYKWRANK